MRYPISTFIADVRLQRMNMVVLVVGGIRGSTSWADTFYQTMAGMTLFLRTHARVPEFGEAGAATDHVQPRVAPEQKLDIVRA